MAYIDKGRIPYYLDTSEEAPMEGRKIAFKSDIDKIPTADVVEVKHGYWIWLEGNLYECSECPNRTEVDEVMGEPKYQFCPFCGAEMDGRK